MRPMWLCLLGLVLFAAGEESRSRVKRIVGGVPAEVPPKLPKTTTTTTEAATQQTTEAPTRQTTTQPPTTQATTRPPTTEPPVPPTDEATVYIRRFRRRALVNGNKNPDGSYSFLGLRYAEPPIKRFRFQRPRRTRLKGVIDAKNYGPPCPQWRRGRLIGNEDCLFLNIYTPELNNRASFPVLVWIHGGNFKTGSAAQYLPTDIVKKGVVVVTVQYRLGSLGFLSLGRKELPGNVGLFDVAAAVHWVNDYIQFFGGDNRRIIPSGQGSGASCASFLPFNNFGRNNIKGIFAMSGSPVSPFTLDENEQKTSNEVAQLNGCNAEEGVKFVRCMQALPLETVLKGDSGIEDNRNKRFDYAKKLSNLQTPGPTEEGKDDHRFLPFFLPEAPFEAMKQGHFPKIPLLTGVTKEETGGGLKGNFLGQITKLLTPEFLQGGMYKDLLYANTGLYVNKTANPSLVKLFSSGDYLKFFSSVVSTALSAIDQFIQHTTDAFFNLPAFITSHLWSQKNKVFLYSFEHPTKPTADQFLQDIPLVPRSQTSNEITDPGHGDDLRYLFDLQSIDGQPMSNSSEMSEADMKVRNHFTTIVAEFARSGTPKTEGGESWTPFTKDEGSYMIIQEFPKLAKGFRKCSMGLWTGDTNILNSVECALSGASKIVTNTLGAAGTQLLNTVNSAEESLGNAAKGVTNGITNASKIAENVFNPVRGNLLGGGGGGNKGGGLLGGGGNSGLLGGGGNKGGNSGLLGGGNKGGNSGILGGGNKGGNSGLLGGRNKEGNSGLLGGNRRNPGGGGSRLGGGLIG